jgi:hypothetical protein
VQLDPGNLHYRLNTANILLEMERATDAIAVLQNAMSLAKAPDQVASVQNLLESARQYQSAREQIGQEQQSAAAIQPSDSQAQSAQETSSIAKPAAPDEPHGPRHGMRGTIRNVHCSHPAILELTVEGEKRFRCIATITSKYSSALWASHHQANCTLVRIWKG